MKWRARRLAVGIALVVLGLGAVGWVYFLRDGASGAPGQLHPNLLGPSHRLQAEAVRLADQLVRDFPSDVDALFVRGLILNKFVSRDEAAECWRECVRRDPDFGEPYYWLGKELFKQGEYDEAVDSLRKAVELEVPMADARIQLADALINLGRPEEAVPLLREQVRVAPKVTAGFFYLGQAYWLVGKLDEAAYYYRRALDLNPDCHQAWHGLAMISHKRGQPEQAREYSRRVRQLQARFHAGHQATRRDYDDTATLEGTLATAYTDAGQIYLARKIPATAEACWARAAQLGPEKAECRMLLVNLYREQDRPKPALPVLEELCRIEPANPIHRYSLGKVQVILGHFDRAEETFSRLIEMTPKRAEGYAALADLYVRTGRELPKAVELARKAVELQPAAEHYFTLSQACANSGDRPGALKAIGQAIWLDPGNPRYQRFQAQWRDGQ